MVHSLTPTQERRTTKNGVSLFLGSICRFGNCRPTQACHSTFRLSITYMGVSPFRTSSSWTPHGCICVVSVHHSAAALASPSGRKQMNSCWPAAMYDVHTTKDVNVLSISSQPSDDPQQQYVAHSSSLPPLGAAARLHSHPAAWHRPDDKVSSQVASTTSSALNDSSWLSAQIMGAVVARANLLCASKHTHPPHNRKRRCRSSGCYTKPDGAT